MSANSSLNENDDSIDSDDHAEIIHNEDSFSQNEEQDFDEANEHLLLDDNDEDEIEKRVDTNK